MKCCQHENTGGSVSIKRLVPILVVLGAIAAIVVVPLMTQSHSVSQGKTMSPPTSSGSELERAGAHQINLDRFNLSNSSAPTKQELMRIVRDWIHGNATQAEVRLAIALWRNESAAASNS